MHLKLTKHGRFCKQNDQLPTKSHDELEDNSIIPITFEIVHSLADEKRLDGQQILWMIWIFMASQGS